MNAKDLIKILEKLPEDTIICKTSGEEGCSDLNSAKYFPQFNILYLEPFWNRESKGYIDMADGNNRFFGQESRCAFTKKELVRIRELAREGKKIVDAKQDGRMHRIRVIDHIIETSNPVNREFVGREFTLLVDDEWVGGLNPTKEKAAVCDFEWESLVRDGDSHVD